MILNNVLNFVFTSLNSQNQANDNENKFEKGDKQNKFIKILKINRMKLKPNNLQLVYSQFK